MDPIGLPTTVLSFSLPSGDFKISLREYLMGGMHLLNVQQAREQGSRKSAVSLDRRMPVRFPDPQSPIFSTLLWLASQRAVEDSGQAAGGNSYFNGQWNLVHYREPYPGEPVEILPVLDTSEKTSRKNEVGFYSERGDRIAKVVFHRPKRNRPPDFRLGQDSESVPVYQVEITPELLKNYQGMLGGRFSIPELESYLGHSPTPLEYLPFPALFHQGEIALWKTPQLPRLSFPFQVKAQAYQKVLRGEALSFWVEGNQKAQRLEARNSKGEPVFSLEKISLDGTGYTEKPKRKNSRSAQNSTLKNMISAFQELLPRPKDSPLNHVDFIWLPHRSENSTPPKELPYWERNQLALEKLEKQIPAFSKTASAETVDRTLGSIDPHEVEILWTWQLLDLLRGTGAKVRLEPLQGQGNFLEVVMPYEKILFGEEAGTGPYTNLPRILNILEGVLGGQATLVRSQPGKTWMRIPSPALAEHLLKQSKGNHALSFQYFWGEIPRDHVIALRAQGKGPMGISRDPLWLEDIESEVPQWFFPLHDLYHNFTSSEFSPEFRSYVHDVYRLAKSEFHGEFPWAETHLDRLADLSPPREWDGKTQSFFKYSLDYLWKHIKDKIKAGKLNIGTFMEYRDFISTYRELLENRPPRDFDHAVWHDELHQELTRLLARFDRILYNTVKHGPRDPIAELSKAVPKAASQNQPPAAKVWSFPQELTSTSGDSYPYRVLIHPAQTLSDLKQGDALPIAQRETQTMQLRLIKEPGPGNGAMIPSPNTEYEFKIEEGTTEGHLQMFQHGNTLSILQVATNRSSHQFKGDMAPGAGSLVLSWAAHQAARNGQEFSIFWIVNPDLIKIQKRYGWMDPDHTWLEAGIWQEHFAGSYDIIHRIPWNDPRVPDLIEGLGNGSFDFLNLHGRPRPELGIPDQAKPELDNILLGTPENQEATPRTKGR